MNQKERILLAFDGSEAAWRALRYTARVASGCREFEVCLFYSLAGLPPEYEEHRGAEDPVEEERLERRLREASNRWIEEHRHDVEAQLGQARAELEKAGVPSSAIEVWIEPTFSEHELVDALVEVAHEAHCTTIAVGRSHAHHVSKLLRRHLSSKLLSKVQELTTWVVA
jgi:nucleotide-binding universal stress UspA family protein